MTVTFTETAVVFSWPFGGRATPGQTVRFFAPVGPFVVSQWGDEWWVRDRRKANHRGGPDDGVTFHTRREVEEHVEKGLTT